MDPELDHLRARHRPAFADAFAAALTAKERALLRLSCCDGLTLAELGALERVHLSTISPRLDALRRRITDETRTNFVVAEAPKVAIAERGAVRRDAASSSWRSR